MTLFPCAFIFLLAKYWLSCSLVFPLNVSGGLTTCQALQHLHLLLISEIRTSRFVKLHEARGGIRKSSQLLMEWNWMRSRNRARTLRSLTGFLFIFISPQSSSSFLEWNSHVVCWLLRLWDCHKCNLALSYINNIVRWSRKKTTTMTKKKSSENSCEFNELFRLRLPSLSRVFDFLSLLT